MVAAGRQNLDTIRKWVVDGAAAVPPGKNHDQMVMQIVNKGLGQLSDIVTKSNGDLATIGGKIRGLGGEYDALGNQPSWLRRRRSVMHWDSSARTANKSCPAPRPPLAARPTRPTTGSETPTSASGKRFHRLPMERINRSHLNTGRTPTDTPLKVGPTTGMYVPGKTWIADEDAPAVQFQEGYRFRIAGTEATDITRVVVDANGETQVQRWVGNVYEYQRNTSTSATGDLAGLPPIQNIDQTWKPIPHCPRSPLCRVRIR